ncbi:MAG: type II toxin-antitoxin system RelB/DinJ family antitoxin [Peptostreptococcaceae bacterium]|nr:type II toxin-antitoxin system RelB/DinJ family antitoxin [Peptostreptococcaceae bacterium]
MKETSNLNIRMDKKLKSQLEEVVSELGLNVSTAVNIFARQVVRQGRIPFEISLDVPNKETVKAMREAESLAREPEAKGYHDVKSLFDELLHD